MRRSLLLITLATLPPAALLLHAQDGKLNCNDRDWNRGRPQFCEMREQTIASAGRLNVDGRQNGGVTIKGWDRADVLVRSQVRTEGQNDGDARAVGAQVIVHAAGAEVAADGPSGKSWTVSYEVFVPRQMDLTLSAHNGGVHVEGVRGNIEFHTENGGVHLANLGGAVKGRTRNGGVHVELEGSRWDGRGLDVETQNGGVHLNVPAKFAAHFEMSTVNGGVKSEFSELALAKHQTQVSADLGGGGSPIRLVTTNGGVHIERTN